MTDTFCPGIFAMQEETFSPPRPTSLCNEMCEQVFVSFLAGMNAQCPLLTSAPHP